MLQRAGKKAQRWSHITPARPGFYTRARQVIADPSNQFVASADNFGRIMLLRQSNLQVLRMWKGYRDAQIGWVLAPDRWPHQVHRSACLLACLPARLDAAAHKPLRFVCVCAQWMGAAAPHRDATGVGFGLFLVLLAPHRHVIEVWRMIRGQHTVQQQAARCVRCGL